MNPVARVLHLPGTPLWRLERALAEPDRAQREMLRWLVSHARGTAWGRAHGFDEIARCSDPVALYQARVGLNTHETLAKWVARVRAGEPDVLWPGMTTHFAVSGGTQSGGRVVPFSNEMMKRMSAASMAPGLSYFATTGRVSILRGRILSVPGHVGAGEFGAGTYTGEVSGLLAKAAPGWAARRLQALPRDVMLARDWETKLDDVIRIASRADVRAIVMVPSWTPPLVKRLQSSLKATDPAEAVRRAWPNMEVFFSGGVALSSYRRILEEYLGPEVRYIESYSGSEGFIAFQEDADAPDLTLHLRSGVFFEFVPREELHMESPSRHTVATVEPGREYGIYASNCSGLWSCAVEDVVRFTSMRPPRLRVVGRTRELLDRFGEALTAEDVHSALAEADTACGSRALQCHVGYPEGCSGESPTHRWLVEFEQPPPDLAAYAAALDRAIQGHNGRYLQRRLPGSLGQPEVVALNRGTFVRYLRSSRARLSAQSKVLALDEDPGIGSGLLHASRGTSDQSD